MKHLRTYNELNEDLILEKLDIKLLMERFKRNPSKKIAKYIIITLMSIYSVTQINDYLSKQNIPNNQISFFNDEIERISNETSDKYLQYKDSISKYMNPLEIKLSQDGWDEIRNEEKLRLKGYTIGDGHITIGYGHAEPISNSKYKKGQIITKEEATKLLHKDVNDSANDLRRIFTQWEKQGLEIPKITQNQYDVMVSLIFNMGIGNFRKSDFIQLVKKNDLESAGNLIKTTKISKKFPGLKKRRLREFKKFTKMS